MRFATLIHDARDNREQQDERADIGYGGGCDVRCVGDSGVVGEVHVMVMRGQRTDRV